MRVFSRRYEDQVFSKKFGLSLPRRVRQRIWFSIEKHNEPMLYHPYPGNSWTESTDVLAETVKGLFEQYGTEQLLAFDDNDQKVVTDLKGFVLRGYPAQVFDVLELTYNGISNDLRIGFQKEINTLLEDENIDWRFADGQFFKMDITVFSKDIVIQTSELLKAKGFEGAVEEFKEARNDFTAGDYKGAILNSCKCLESVLKVVNGKDRGTARALIQDLAASGFYSDVPDEVGRAFGDSVLMALPFLRNKLGGHGQGEEIIAAPKEYAELAVHLAGSFVLFIIRHSLSISGQKTSEEGNAPIENDDLPF